MNFWDIYWPVFAAFISATILFEGIHFLVGLIAAKRQLKRIQEQAQLMMEQGGSPGAYGNNPLMMFDLNPNMYGGGTFPTTTSGNAEDKEKITHGQYL